MAAVHFTPAPAVIEDPVTYKEASALLADTPYAPTSKAIARWVAAANRIEVTIPVEREGRTDRVSWTLLVREHKKRTAQQLRDAAR
ncbi:hypothetical protein AB0M00_43785 [Streptomyces chartreusis]|uniref:hypothetical protein n=1 Tax=Streptomyces chartreusis TaxID=1969 RepID=UPI00343C23F9